MRRAKAATQRSGIELEPGAVEPESEAGAACASTIPLGPTFPQLTA